MTRRKHGLGLLGLLVVAALGVMAFAASAQAVVPKFNLDGTTGDFNVEGTQEGLVTTLLVPNSNLTLTCTEFEVKEGLVLEERLVAHAKLLYKGCTTSEHKAAGSLPCHVSDVHQGEPEKLHVTATALLLPVEISAGVYGILAEKLLVQIDFLKGTGCPLPLKNVIKGEVCFKITSGNDTASPLIQTNQTIQGECPAVSLEGTGAVANDKLLFGANEAFVIGAATLTDVGAAGGKIGVLLL